MDKVREPAVSGQFYPSSVVQLRRQITSFLSQDKEKTKVIGCMLPHAGYVYSGRVAVETLSAVEIKEKIVLLGPNHTGMGEPFSIMTSGVWQTPLGGVKIASDLAKQILANSKLLQEDDLAHMHEHSLEVELPILQYFKSGIKIVPIAFLSDDTASLKQVGADIASVINLSSQKDSVMLVASSDMTHYEPLSVAEKKDAAAIEAILELNEEKLMQVIARFNISMCGYAPVVVMLAASKLLGATKARLIKYETSAAASGDATSVVGYAGIIVY
ncbi:MAG: AmmeMemoRadiSam system protein B [Candidatus Omnitrophica bacterium]|nr:AmmeMemoRadiSam system protein B [Candidatus Omnitrophota bacterium]